MIERYDYTPVALYARVSSDRQDVDLSVAAQLRALRDYAEKNGYLVAREFIDEADHRRHAEIENAIRDLKYGVGLNHMPPEGLLPRRTAHPLGTPPHPASATALALGNPVQSRPGTAASDSTPNLTTRLQLTRHPANRTSPQTRASPVRERLLPCPLPAISLTTATVGRHRRPQKHLQTAANPSSTRIRARIIALVTPSPPFQCPHAVHRWIRA